MLSDKQKRAALKKNIRHARDMARQLRADGVEGITLTHYADEASFHAMKLPEEGDDFEYRQLVNTETAKVMLAHGLQLEVQVLVLLCQIIKNSCDINRLACACRIQLKL